jgi:hypothetical protein
VEEEPTVPGRPEPKAYAPLAALAAIVALGLAAPGAIPAAQAAQTAPTECAVPAETSPVPALTPTLTPPTPTPIAYSDATPTASPVPPSPTATPDPEELLADELAAVAMALARCLSEGEAETVVSLATERYLGRLFGGGEPLPREAYLAVAPELDRVPVQIVSLNGVEREGQAAEAEVVSVVGNQLSRGRWRFVQAPRSEREAGTSAWRVDAEEALSVEPPRGATRLDVTLEEYAISLDPATAGEEVVLRGSNLGVEDHEMLVLRFEDGLTTGDLLRATGPGLPQGITYVGQATVPAGAEAELVLTGLEPGAYTVVCLLPTNQGVPHLALGMAATFEVE